MYESRAAERSREVEVLVIQEEHETELERSIGLRPRWISIFRSNVSVTVTVVKTGVTKLIPWMLVMILVDIIVVMLVTFVPGFCTWLPDLLLGAM